MTILREIVDGAMSASALEQVATILGIAGVWLMIRQSLWAFPAGIIQVVIFGCVCFEGRLYSETVLQLMFLVALLHGWWHWTHPSGGAAVLPVQRLSPRARIAWTAGTLALWSVWGTGMHRFTDAALPYWDGFVFATSVSSQWLQARKAIENWTGWLIANTVAIGVFAAKGYWWFAVLYAIFWLMALAGLRAWSHPHAESAAHGLTR